MNVQDATIIIIFMNLLEDAIKHVLKFQMNIQQHLWDGTKKSV